MQRSWLRNLKIPLRTPYVRKRTYPRRLSQIPYLQLRLLNKPVNRIQSLVAFSNFALNGSLFTLIFHVANFKWFTTIIKCRSTSSIKYLFFGCLHMLYTFIALFSNLVALFTLNFCKQVRCVLNVCLNFCLKYSNLTLITNTPISIKFKNVG